MFISTRAAGLEALAQFAPLAGAEYTRNRNSDDGPARANVSGLSPYIRHRLVTEREVVAAVLQRHRFEACEKFVQEVMWRTYWKGWLEHNPEVWRRYRRELAGIIDAGETDSRGYLDAVAGRTGIDAMDTWVLELKETGYLHNHTRMWFASIWIFTLGLPWQLGADFFYRHLLDGDAASNTLSWRWVAGLQTVGKAYLATASNISRFTQGRYSPTGLATSAHPITEEALPPRVDLRMAENAPPSNDVRTGSFGGDRVGFLVHEEDLDPQSLAADSSGFDEWHFSQRRGSGLEPAMHGLFAATAAYSDSDARSPLGAADAVHQFTSAAVADAASRLSLAAGKPTQVLADATAATVAEWVELEGLHSLVVPYAPVGPVQDRLEALSLALRDHGVTLTTVSRRWDTLAWPHAVRGFFPFRERIPGLLRQHGLL